MTERIPALKREPQPARRRGGKLLAIVVLLFVIVLVVLFFRSSLAKISSIEVRGVHLLSAEQVRAALGAVPGDSFFTPGAGTLERRVAALGEVASVQVVKRFPGKLIVNVEEHPEVAVELGPDGRLMYVLANGLSVRAPDRASADKPVLTGWAADDPYRAALAARLAEAPPALLADLSEIVPDPSAVYPDRIRLYTRSRFEAVTTVAKLPDKLPILREIVENREPGRVVLLEADTYMPFSAQEALTESEKPDEHKEKDTTQ